ncbi:MAG: glycosyltransferase family 39 protein [Epsilonproteobacteria bacterium]|nr:glycosyltransferase family 39 protein [Campylobacterota bacterium]
MPVSRRSLLPHLLIFIAVVTLYRLFILTHAQNYIDLYADEAYYWGWAQHFDFGYYSKPPMVAWLIMAGTALFGDTFVGIKIMSLAVYVLTTLNIYFLAKALFDDETVAFFSGAAFITLPAVWLSSLIVSTDVPFLFFWSLAMLFFVKAIKDDRWRDWIITGIAGGGGLMSKYTMVIFVVSALIYLAGSPIYRRHLKNPKLYAAMGIAALLFLPNLWWNYTHDFVSVKHVSHDNAKIRGLHFRVNKMLEFLASQFGVFGPIFFGWLLALLPKTKTLFQKESYRLLWWFIVPMFGLILTISLLSRAFANWSAPMYVASTVLVTAWLVYHRRRWLYAALIVNIVLGIGLYHLHQITDAVGIEMGRHDPYNRVRGWKRLGEAVSSLLARHPNAKLLSDDRKELAEMIYYVRPHPFNALIWNPDGSKKNQYEMDTDMNRHIGENFILITEEPDRIEDVAPSFEEVKPLKTIQIPITKGFEMVYYVYYLKHFKGYEKR